MAATRKAFQLAGAVDASDHWIGGELVVVQTGDQLDRGDDEQAILEFLARVQREASEAGGTLHILNGNHEFMNALGDLRYVTTGGFEDFEDAPGVESGRGLAGPVHGQLPRVRRGSGSLRFGPARRGPRARQAQRGVVVGDSVFVHGGITPAWAGQLTRSTKTRAHG